VSGPKTAAALERAELAERMSELQNLIDFGLARIRGDDDDVLEITHAVWQTETHGGKSLVILTREMLCVVLEPVATGLLRRKSEPACVQIPFTAVKDLIDDDSQFDGSVIYFVGAQDNPEFLLTFERSAERDRFYRCVFQAHRGDFSQWGQQLDPSEYATDFDRFYAEIAASGIEDSVELIEWVEENYGDFPIDSALGLAREWRMRELSDIARPNGTPMRVALIGSPRPWGDVPESRRVLVRLGEEFFDAGLLKPPYDERTYETNESLRALDAGPARLLAVMTLAGFARDLRDPRAQEFIDAARPHLNSIPAEIFTQELRDLWADIAPLPDPKAPREFDIWEDSDVREVCSFEEDRVVYDQDVLSDADRKQVTEFLAIAGAISADSAESTLAAGLAGVKAYEELSPMCPSGWRKLVVYNVSEFAHSLWHRHALTEETAMLAQWVTVTIEANGWGPNGNASPLGQHHSYCMNLAGQTGVGILTIDPESGRASAPTGDEARRAAQRGSF